MKLLKMMLLTALLGCVSGAFAAEQYRVTHETEASSITLPSTVPGTLIVSACRACPVLRVSVTDSTQFQIGETLVGLADMRVAMAGRPGALMLLQTTSNDSQLLMLSISAETN